MEIKGMTVEIEVAEENINAFAAQAEDAPHKWGHEQSEKLHRMTQELTKLYDEA
jgi:hypothetical protein